MYRFAQVLLAAVCLSAIFSWAAIAYLWSDQQRLVALMSEFEKNSSFSAVPASAGLTEQALVKLSDQDERLAALEQAVSSAAASNLVKTTNQPALTAGQKIGAGEYFIPLGSGTTTSRDWVDLPATTVSVNTDQYHQIKAVYLESGLSIVGGEVHVRLKNLSTGAILNTSEIFHNTQQPTTQVSSGFTLHSGSHAYLIQIKSSSGELARVEGARLRLVVE